VSAMPEGDGDATKASDHEVLIAPLALDPMERQLLVDAEKRLFRVQENRGGHLPDTWAEMKTALDELGADEGPSGSRHSWVRRWRRRFRVRRSSTPAPRWC
jgi:hypothetical protein